MIRAWIGGQGVESDWKLRPAVVLAYDFNEDRYAVAVCTTKLDPQDPNKVPITSGRSGERTTGLRIPSAVNCSWRLWIDREDVESKRGDLPPGEFNRVLARVIELNARK